MALAVGTLIPEKDGLGGRSDGLPEPMIIHVAAPGVSAFPVLIFDSYSVASVKLRIQDLKGFVVREQELVFGGWKLARNQCLIGDYGVSDGNLLHLVIRLPDVRLITVRSASGKTMSFWFEHGKTVSDVKRQIEKDDEEPVAHSDQRLVLNGQELDDGGLIHDICQTDGTVIELLIQKSSAPVKVKDPVAKKDSNGSSKGDEALVELELIVVNPEAAIPSEIWKLVESALAGLKRGHRPVMSSEGTGGVYFMRDASGSEMVGVFKPMDEEPTAKNNPRGLPVSSTGEGLNRGTRVGEGALREVAAYILDHPVNGRRQLTGVIDGFAGVPPTTMVRCSFFGKVDKIGSLQAYKKNGGSSEEMGPSVFPVREVHKICVLDIRLANADRHGGNILVCKDDDGTVTSLVPIDHGYCLPENFQDCTFEWLYWPQSRMPFDSNTIDYIKSLDAEEDIDLLKFHGWDLPNSCARTLRISTMLLKKGVNRGLTAYDIGSILCRETVKKESVIERIIREAEFCSLPMSSEAAFLESVSEIMDMYLDGLSK